MTGSLVAPFTPRVARDVSHDEALADAEMQDDSLLDLLALYVRLKKE